MKNLVKILFILLLFSSCEEPKEVYETEIKTYVVSNKYERDYVNSYSDYYIYFQTTTSTEKAKVTFNTYESIEVGDTIKVLIKYWEKPKKK